VPGALATEGRDAHPMYGHLGVLVLVLIFASIILFLAFSLHPQMGFARHEGRKRETRPLPARDPVLGFRLAVVPWRLAPVAVSASIFYLVFLPLHFFWESSTAWDGRRKE
jgi:hypothetical protein